MIIKSFVGASVAEALKQIRLELGPKAVVLKTRALKANQSGTGRRMVEITACLESPTVGAIDQSNPGSQQERISSRQAKPALGVGHKRFEIETNPEPMIESGDELGIDPFVKMAQSRPEALNISNQEEFVRRLEEKLDQILDAQLKPVNTSEYSAEFAEVVEILREQDIPDRLLRPIMERLIERNKTESSKTGLQLAEEFFVAEIAEHSAPGYSLKPGDVALFVGPFGSGKTSVLGKVAVDLIFKKRIKTRLTTLDDFRVGAQEEIAGYSEALGAALVDAKELAKTSARTGDGCDSVLLIDCHSNIYDQKQFTALIERSEALKPTVVFLTVSALTRTSDLTRLLKRFARFNPTQLIVTHVDLTDSFGGIYTTLKDSDLKLVALTDTAGSVGEILAPDPGAIARNIFGRSNDIA